jgi:hypothetical protein
MDPRTSLEIIRNLTETLRGLLLEKTPPGRAHLHEKVLSEIELLDLEVRTYPGCKYLLERVAALRSHAASLCADATDSPPRHQHYLWCLSQIDIITRGTARKRQGDRS